MANTYRVHYRRGDLDIEVESTDKNYCDTKLAELLDLKPTSAVPSGGRRRKSSAAAMPKKQADTQPGQENEAEESVVDIPGLVGFIKDSEKYAQVEEHILNRKQQLPRIMTALCFAPDFLDDPHLSTTQIELVTDQLGVRIKAQNVNNTIKKNQKYFTARAVRKRGSKVPYKLNRQGVQAFETCLQGTKI